MSRKRRGKRSNTSPTTHARSIQMHMFGLRNIPKMTAEMREALEAVKPFIKALNIPTIASCKTAHAKVHDLVLSDESHEKISPLDQLLFLLSLRISVSTLRGYATLDADQLSQIDALIAAIEKYVKDVSQQRPLNFMMLASPGAGKSHFIKCVAERLAPYNISAITFNMAGMQSNEDLVPPLDAARNLKVEDRLPLLFLDEFDSDPDYFSLLLPLLWDGGLNLGQRDLRLGKVIIVMAGSNPSLPETMNHALSMRKEIPTGTGCNPKLVDLFSRINGDVIRIQPFYDTAHKIDRRVDKVCIAVELLQKRFKYKLKKVPLALLRFVAKVDFRYDVRSIAHLIDLIPYKPSALHLSLDELDLPLDSASRLKSSSIAYHLLHEDQAYGVVKDWQEAAKTKTMIAIESVWVNRLMHVPEDILPFYIHQALEYLKGEA